MARATATAISDSKTRQPVQLASHGASRAEVPCSGRLSSLSFYSSKKPMAHQGVALRSPAARMCRLDTKATKDTQHNAGVNHPKQLLTLCTMYYSKSGYYSAQPFSSL